MAIPAVFAFEGFEALPSPALLFYKDRIASNLDRVLELAGSPSRVRPHVKTHKTREIVRMALQRGITKHKCATIAEAEMLAQENVPDVLIAFPIVGPNVGRVTRLVELYPGTSFAVLIDDNDAGVALAEDLKCLRLHVRFLLDLDVGQHRTGAPVEEAEALYTKLAALPNLKPDGFQLYDGHNKQPDRAEREACAAAFLEPILAIRERLEAKGIPVPRLVCGGTPTFPVYANMAVPGLECSPGTFVLHDAGYGDTYEDLKGFQPAAFVLTRVISKPKPDRVTFDCGTKSIASDPPAGKRLKLVGVEEFIPFGHNEEHFIIETPTTERFRIGEEFLALPTHVCPTVAVHAHANIIEGGKLVGTWQIAARDRKLTV